VPERGGADRAAATHFDTLRRFLVLCSVDIACPYCADGVLAYDTDSGKLVWNPDKNQNAPCPHYCYGYYRITGGGGEDDPVYEDWLNPVFSRRGDDGAAASDLFVQVVHGDDLPALQTGYEIIERKTYFVNGKRSVLMDGFDPEEQVVILHAATFWSVDPPSLAAELDGAGLLGDATDDE
jgi:hypothetical protein